MIIGKESLDLKLVLIESAQCFRWIEQEGRFGCVLNGNPVWLHETPEGIDAEGDFDPDWLRHYLDLDRDYGKVAREYDHIPVAKRAIEMFPGMRVLNQPVWEALIMFILSANNNVSRIRSLTDALCRRFGNQWDFDEISLFDFPNAEQLARASEDELRAMKMGYRAPFLIETSRRICEGFPMDQLKSMPYEEALRTLTTLPGVGDKVANCVLLFGCEHASAFPVDVWVDKLLKSWFGVEYKSRIAMMKEARARLGANAGLLQQFLFHAARTGAIEI